MIFSEKNTMIRENWTIIGWKYTIFYLKVYDPQFICKETEINGNMYTIVTGPNP